MPRQGSSPYPVAKVTFAEPRMPTEPASLVNEAYIRLRKIQNMQWNDRHHFFSVVAVELRRILVDQARIRVAQKREGSQRREVEAEYKTPAGEKRFIAVTVSAVPAVDGGLLGAACLINDRTEMEEMRRQQELQTELSAEMALQLRNSLTTISGYALQLADSRDADLAKQLAIDIAHEAAQLDHSIGGFLNRKHAAQGAAAGSTF